MAQNPIRRFVCLGNRRDRRSRVESWGETKTKNEIPNSFELILFIRSRMTMRNTKDIVSKPPAGFNKEKRDQCKTLLIGTCAFMMVGNLIWASICSAMALMVLKEGTLASTRNLKWLLLSSISFCSSLCALILYKGYDIVDENKAYALKISLLLGAKSIQTGWSVILGLFLFSAFTSSSPPKTN